MCEGKILLGILSLILYRKYRVRRLSASFTGELSYDACRLLARDGSDAEDSEEMESRHAGIPAQSRFLIGRQHESHPSFFSQSF